ncbi:non-ribosomal peptide synthetase [Kitasatospora brasiliensis]|uniref:non-ribosomal peptide synthetase n=1 Tax=Kitasatospora brasiliensis TaxID=3058040 RepID=UPI00292D71D4|nr:non-ribosomal peptide synthetase [Kitasatospora sp. K002]
MTTPTTADHVGTVWPAEARRRAVPLPGLSEAPLPAALAALVAVVRRRTLQETVRIALPGGGSVGVGLDDDPSFAALTDRLAAALGPAGPERSDPAAPPPDLGYRAEPDAAPASDAPVELLITSAGPRLAHDPLRTTTAEADRIAALCAAAWASGRRAPDTRLSELGLVSSAERLAIAALEGTSTPATPVRPIHELVHRQALRTPDAPAVSVGPVVLDYRTLDQAADRVAARLRRCGVGAEEVVALVADRSPDLIVALLGVLKAGAAYLALDGEVPAARLSGLLADAGVRLVLASAASAARIPEGFSVQPLTEPEAAAPAPAAEGPAGAHALAYVSYTSGSTGTPKGVAVPHAAVSRLVNSPRWAEFTAQDVFLQAAPVAFDAATLEIWAPLCNGGRLALLPPGPADLDRIADTVRAEGVTVLWLTAGLFHQLVARRPDAFDGLRHVLAGGDVISPAAVAQLFAAAPGLRFTNGYGPTENTTFTACATLDAAADGDTVPIGRPIDGTRTLVLDPRLRPVPVGVPGELYAAGTGLARGYLGRPGATAERFVPDPSGREPGARLYRTGDLVRRLPDGDLVFLGRMDRQVKVNGYRVEPAEIEEVLLGHPAIGAAAVLARPGTPGSAGASGTRLVGYLVPADPAADPTGLVEEAHRVLRERLPSYLVPSWLIPLPELPLTPNGKVDRAALPPVVSAPRPVSNPYVAARTSRELVIAEIWAEVLKLDQVGMEDDFFELGGHSLLAAELLTRLQLDLGVEISARTLYLRPTVAELAEETDERLAATTTTEEHS